MDSTDLRLKADHFRSLACNESDPAMRAELRMLAGEYEAAAAQIDSGGTPLSAQVTLPNC